MIAVAVLALVFVALARLVVVSRRQGVRLPPDVVLGAGDLAGVTLLIDPGHGGTDPGAVVAGTREDELNYRMAATLAAVVRGAGGSVRYTVTSRALLPTVSCCAEPELQRADDAMAVTRPGRLLRSGRRYSADLYDRAEAGRNLRGRVMFISLHHDAGATTRRGAHVLVDARSRQPSFAGVLSERLSAAGLGGDMERRNLGVLRASHNAIENRVLLEVATITNGGERRAAKDVRWRWRVARIVAAAIRDTPRAS